MTQDRESTGIAHPQAGTGPIRRFGHGIVPYLFATIIGSAGVWIALWVRLPLPWFLGPMIGIAAGALLGLRLTAPNFLRPVALPVLGVTLGASFQPEILGQMGDWTLSVAVVPVYLIMNTAIGYLYFRAVARYDRITSYFASVPGGLTAMVLMGEYYGGDQVRIAIAHSLRIIVVVLAMALVFGFYLGVSQGSVPRPVTSWEDVGLEGGMWLLGCAVAGAVLGRLLRLAMPDLMGPLILSILVHGATWVTTGAPTILSDLAQFVLGAGVGARFAGLDFRSLSREFMHGAVSALLLVGSALVAAALVSAHSNVNLFEGWLAFSPGGIMEMSLLALAINQSVAYVSIMHVLRFVVVMFAAPLFVKLAFGRPPARKG